MVTTQYHPSVPQTSQRSCTNLDCVPMLALLRGNPCPNNLRLPSWATIEGTSIVARKLRINKKAPPIWCTMAAKTKSVSHGRPLQGTIIHYKVVIQVCTTKYDNELQGASAAHNPRINIASIVCVFLTFCIKAVVYHKRKRKLCAHNAFAEKRTGPL